jgi:hypothetical protein
MDWTISLPQAIIVGSGIIAIAIVCAAIVIARRLRPTALNLPQQFSPMPFFVEPHSVEGHPVEPSGISIQPETVLETGTTVLAFSQGRWWRAEVVRLEGDDLVHVHFPGWDAIWDESFPRSDLQVDLGAER